MSAADRHRKKAVREAAEQERQREMLDKARRLVGPCPPFVAVDGVEWCEVHQSTRHERFHECWALYAGATADGAKPCRFVPLYIKEES